MAPAGDNSPMSDDTLLLALDYGGTKLSAAALPLAALRTADRRLSPHRHYSPPDAAAAYEQAAMLDLARMLLDGRPPAAVGVSFGGPVDFTTGTVRLSHHVAGWEATPLADLLAAVFDAPVAVDNDANVAALGEYRFGAGTGLDSLLYVTISTGVGAGWILDGRPWRGHDGMAGELGHTVVDPAGPLCLCGKRGCVERLASGPYMVQDAIERLAADPAAGPTLRTMAAASGELDGRQVAEAAAAGDSIARDVLLRGARALGVGLGNAANLVNPQRIILGGGVTKSGPLWWGAVRAAARATALPELSLDIVPATWEDDAPLWGALALATDRLNVGL